MNEKKVEPFLCFLLGFPKGDSTILHLVMKSFVSNIPNSVQREFGASFLEQDGLDGDSSSVFDSFGVGGGISWQFDSTEIIDETGGGEEIKCAECSFL